MRSTDVKFCDLHMHSTCSDGTFTPSQLVAHAAERDLAAIALTDHDTLAGLAEAREAASAAGIAFIPGVEISVTHGTRTVHVLGYGFQAKSDQLQRALDDMVKWRVERNHKIVARLNELLEIGGENLITYDEIEREAGGGIVGRPHFARVLLRRGHVAEVKEAFDKYLGRGTAAYFDREHFTMVDAVRLICDAGGVAVLAHPKLLPLREGETLVEVVRSLVEVGLKGIECYYSLHTTEETFAYLDVARQFHLMVTGGSDFHGSNKPDIDMGTGLGDLRVPMECAEGLLTAARC